MLDNLRDDSSSSPFFEDEFPDFLEDDGDEKEPTTPKFRRSYSGNFLGKPPDQRFVIAVMLMITFCILGTMTLLVTGRFMLF
jgi:hypothetical protein